MSFFLQRNTKEDIWKNVVNQTVNGAPLTSIVFSYGGQWGPSINLFL